jgi:16S rRNA processing protein RimM
MLVREGVRSEVEVLSVAVHGTTPVLRFDGVETPEAARKLTGCEIVVPREAAAGLQSGEYYVVDLVGLVVRANGEVRGTVTSVVEAAQAPLLEIEPAHGGGRPALVPFMDRYVGLVDLAAGSIEVREPWILDFE